MLDFFADVARAAAVLVSMAIVTFALYMVLG